MRSLGFMQNTKTIKLEGTRGNKKWQTVYRTATTTYPCFLPDLGGFDRS